MSSINSLESRLQESFDQLWSTFVDPQDAWDDAGGERWNPLFTSAAGSQGGACSLGIQTESQLREVRNRCRQLAASNEFAINGHENRISYIVGAGHNYRAAAKKGGGAPVELMAAVQAELDRFITVNDWHRRQQEIVRRRDRDGEAFLRLFVADDGTTQIRFVEPDQVSTPNDRAGDPAAAFGLQTQPDDVESVLAYYIDGRPVDASQIQHRKANVDGNVRRGVPLFLAVEKNLRRAEKLLRNMSAVAAIQSAIALIRKHRGGRTAVQQFVNADGGSSTPNSQGTVFRRYAPGTILDAPAGLEYDFPAAGLDASAFVTVLQAELRAIASRLVMPEFMLTSDASNANYSSTMVAEGPAMKMFSRLQAEQIADDVALLWRVLDNLIFAGRLPRQTRGQIEIQASGPTLAVRDALQEVQAFQIEHAAGILSPQTWSQRRGLDYAQEQENLAAKS